MANVGLTTIDNPYNPLTQFDKWFLYDTEKGYNSCALLARIANLDPNMTEKEEDEEVERAVDEIVKQDFTSLYRKVKA